MPVTRRFLLAAGASLPLAAPALAQAPAWPSRPVTIVVAFAPGGAADVLARIIAQQLSTQLGQPFVVENRVGGGGTLSAAAVAQARPDGQTLLLLTSGHAVNETLAPARGYDILRDLKPAALFAETPYWLVTPPNRATSLADLLEKAKKEPMTFASGGPGGLAHLLGEMLRQDTKLDLTHIPYRGNSPALTDLLAGRVDMLFDNSGAVVDHIKGGRLKALATTSAARLPATPDVPTMAEQGFPDFVVSAWLGLAAPAATDPRIVARLADEVAKAVASPEVVARINTAGAEPKLLDAEGFQALVQREIPRWAEVIKTGNVTVN